VGTISSKSYSQKPDKGATLSIINHSLSLQTELEVKQSTLIVRVKDDKGKLIREDRARIPELALEAYYEKETSSLCIPCITDVPDCGTRKLIDQKIKKTTGRIMFPVTNEENYLQLKKYLEHLIRIESEIGYKDEINE
jgi:hypothetical protein